MIGIVSSYIVIVPTTISANTGTPQQQQQILRLYYSRYGSTSTKPLYLYSALLKLNVVLQYR